MSSVSPYSETSLSPMFRELEFDDARDCSLVVSEEAGLGFLALRGTSSDAGFSDGVKQVLGTGLPKGPAQYREIDGNRIFCISPDEWLVVLPQEDVAQTEIALRKQLTGHYALVDVSGGYTLITLNGSAAEQVLKKSAVYDFHRRNFPIGRSVQTLFAAATALISRTGDESFDLVIRRSFADHIARWIVDAGAEYGITNRSPAQPNEDAP